MSFQVAIVLFIALATGAFICIRSFLKTRSRLMFLIGGILGLLAFAALQYIALTNLFIHSID
jgi:hypothetical protein